MRSNLLNLDYLAMPDFVAGLRPRNDDLKILSFRAERGDCPLLASEGVAIQNNKNSLYLDYFATARNDIKNKLFIRASETAFSSNRFG